MILHGKFCSSLEKILPVKELVLDKYCRGTALRGEKFSLQFAFKADEIHGCPELSVSVESPLQEHIRIRMVELVPCRFLGHRLDDDIVSDQPGLFPDPLMEIDRKRFRVPKGYWKSLWIDIQIPEDCSPGKYALHLKLKDVSPGDYKVREDQTSPSVRQTFQLEVIDAVLPPQKLIHTEWMHVDCLMNYYHEEAWTEKFWTILESFMHSAVDHGINMLFTPVFTPTLDTAVGGERRTSQLVRVIQDNTGKYQFDFSRLRRWILLARKVGYEYLEISHLFTQWGAKCCPKIMIEIQGKEEKCFGWDTASDSSEYVHFLEVFLPSLTEFLEQNWPKEKVYFHCSDEPSRKQLKSYEKASELLRRLTPGYHTFDALSDLDFYRKGLVSIPVAGTAALDRFVAAGVSPLWTYYCCGEQYKFSNRLLYMTSSRNRAEGLILYRYNLDGFLQWGFNFYNTTFSVRPINPWLIQDADYAWPAGDAFMVYPGDDGNCVDSLKQEVFFEGLQDLRALCLLENLIGRQKVIAMLDRETPTGRLTAEEYPRGINKILNLRAKINRRIQKSIRREE